MDKIAEFSDFEDARRHCPNLAYGHGIPTKFELGIPYFNLEDNYLYIKK